MRNVRFPKKSPKTGESGDFSFKACLKLHPKGSGISNTPLCAILDESCGDPSFGSLGPNCRYLTVAPESSQSPSGQFTPSLVWLPLLFA
jgi:hypothetical protein